MATNLTLAGTIEAGGGREQATIKLRQRGERLYAVIPTITVDLSGIGLVRRIARATLNPAVHASQRMTSTGKEQATLEWRGDRLETLKIQSELDAEWMHVHVWVRDRHGDVVVEFFDLDNTSAATLNAMWTAVYEEQREVARDL